MTVEQSTHKLAWTPFYPEMRKDFRVGEVVVNNDGVRYDNSPTPSSIVANWKSRRLKKKDERRYWWEWALKNDYVPFYKSSLAAVKSCVSNDSLMLCEIADAPPRTKYMPEEVNHANQCRVISIIDVKPIIEDFLKWTASLSAEMTGMHKAKCKKAIEIASRKCDPDVHSYLDRWSHKSFLKGLSRLETDGDYIPNASAVEAVSAYVHGDKDDDLIGFRYSRIIDNTIRALADAMPDKYFGGQFEFRCKEVEQTLDVELRRRLAGLIGVEAASLA